MSFYTSELNGDIITNINNIPSQNYIGVALKDLNNKAIIFCVLTQLSFFYTVACVIRLDVYVTNKK